MDFRLIISFFTNTSPEKIGIYLIHLEKADERIELINNLFSKLNLQPDFIDGANGKEIVERGHPDTGILNNNIGNGAVGCTYSHIKMIRRALEEGKEYAVIFEDDCIFKNTINDLTNAFITLKQLIHSYNIKFDIFVLGAIGYTSHIPNPIGISTIYNIEGSHAILLNRKAMKSYIDEYTKSLSVGHVECADAYYNILLNNNIKGIGFTDSKQFFEQKQEGLWSYVGDCLK